MTDLQLIKLRDAADAMAVHCRLSIHGQPDERDERERLALFYLNEAALAAGLRLVPVASTLPVIEIKGSVS